MEANYFVRHWRGELSLAKSFWINCLAVNFVTSTALAEITSRISGDSSLAHAISIIFYWAAALGIFIWQVVGLSASAYKRGNAPDGKKSMMLGLFAAAGMTALAAWGVSTTGIPNLRDAYSIFRDDIKYGPCETTVLPWGTDIELKGWISPSSPKRLEKLLAENPGVKTLFLNTNGGRITEADKIAALVRKHELDVYVALECLSAGNIILAAGKSRVARDGAVIGLHSAFIPGVKPSLDMRTALSAPMVDALRKVGAQEAFILKVLMTGSDDMLKPGLDELLKQGLITRIVSRYGEGYGLDTSELSKTSPASIRRSILEDSGELRAHFKALENRVPAKFEAAIQESYAATLKGADLQTSVAPVIQLYYETITALAPNASDRAMHNLAHLRYKLASICGPLEPHNTLLRLLNEQESAWQGHELKTKLPNYPLEAHNNYLTALLEDATVELTEAERAAGKKYFLELFRDAGLTAEEIERMRAIDSVRSFSADEARQAVEAFRKLYGAVLKLPLEKQGQAMRCWERGGE